MRISEYFHLNLAQPSLDFVDIDTVDDTKIFVDPSALRLIKAQWAEECIDTIQQFFHMVISAILADKEEISKYMLSELHEPNETHLGLSKGIAKGTGLGKISSDKVWWLLSTSKALKSGLIEDLEDSLLMIDGISFDRISDMTTNIIRDQLIRYTQDRARYYGIPLAGHIPSGPIWNPASMQWETKFVELPKVKGRKLLLVPKAIVRRKMEYNVSEYYRNYVLEFLRQKELSENSELVEVFKNGNRRVQSKLLKKKYGTGKANVVKITQAFPTILDQYRSDKQNKIKPPLSHQELAKKIGTPIPDWMSLVAEVLACRPGEDDSDRYARSIEAFLSALFYPALVNPVEKQTLHLGQKKRKIAYLNIAQTGFFSWLALNHGSIDLIVECRNFTCKSEELDLEHLCADLSPTRGTVGILVCRGVEDKQKSLEKCKNIVRHSGCYILVLGDSDLKQLAVEKTHESESLEFQFLQSKFNQLLS